MQKSENLKAKLVGMYLRTHLPILIKMKMGLLQCAAGVGDLTCWATNDSDLHSSPATEWTSGVAHWGLTSATGLETALVILHIIINGC